MSFVDCLEGVDPDEMGVGRLSLARFVADHPETRYGDALPFPSVGGGDRTPSADRFLGVIEDMMVTRWEND